MTVVLRRQCESTNQKQIEGFGYCYMRCCIDCCSFRWPVRRYQGPEPARHKSPKEPEVLCVPCCCCWPSGGEKDTVLSLGRIPAWQAAFSGSKRLQGLPFIVLYVSRTPLFRTTETPPTVFVHTPTGSGFCNGRRSRTRRLLKRRLKRFVGERWKCTTWCVHTGGLKALDWRTHGWLACG